MSCEISNERPRLVPSEAGLIFHISREGGVGGVENDDFLTDASSEIT